MSAVSESGTQTSCMYALAMFGEPAPLLEEAVSEARWDEQRVVAKVFGGLDHLAQVVERRRPLCPRCADVLAVASMG